MKENMYVLKVEPKKYPEPVEIGSSLEDLQKAVGGILEVSYPFEDNVGILLNEEGKLIGLPLNRAIRDDNGNLIDVYAGTFYVVGLTEEDFCSLTEEQMDKFEQLFHQPEDFLILNRGIVVIPIPDEEVEKTQNGKVEPSIDDRAFDE